MMTELLAPLYDLNWENLDAVNCTASMVLKKLATDKALLRSKLEGVANDPELLSMAEHYDILDKVVLHNDHERGFRIRLHVFLPGYFDRPHNHRWTYTSLILHGSYRHFMYPPDDNIHDGIDVSELKPVLIREERAGDSYTLHHRMVHSVVSEPYTVTLILRGPSTRDRFLVMDRKTNQAWWQYGANNESPEERRVKQMPLSRLDATIKRLSELGLI